ncbi:MAG: transposase [Candidatus Cloacimonetes bacterium]|nr:transposase [Candidatus Cloacimonadota bacterium]
MLKKYKHTPAHLLLDDTFYMITGSVYKKRKLLIKDDAKESLLNSIHYWIEKLEWELFDWVILDNHYHLLAKSNKGRDLPKFIQQIHRKSATEINQINGFKVKPLWYNYWDTCIRDKKDYFTRMNYILYNPIKHKYVKEVSNYKWSSFRMRLGKEGIEELQMQFALYDYRDLELGDEDNF